MGKINNLSSPEPIAEYHQSETFSSGEPTLDDWLKRRALKNDRNNASRTFVVHQNNKIVGYYCLATGSVEINNVPSKIKRNMPNPIPVMVLGRLAVDTGYQELGIGKGLLKDAILRTFNVSQNVGIKALLVHALSDSAKHFYKRYGFVQSPLEEMTLMLAMNDIEKLLKA